MQFVLLRGDNRSALVRRPCAVSCLEEAFYVGRLQTYFVGVCFFFFLPSYVGSFGDGKIDDSVTFAFPRTKRFHPRDTVLFQPRKKRLARIDRVGRILVRDRLGTPCKKDMTVLGIRVLESVRGAFHGELYNSAW